MLLFSTKFPSEIAAALDLATSTPLTEGSRKTQRALYYFWFFQFCTDDLDPLVPNIGLGKTCTEFVDKYLHSAIDKLLQDLTPKEVCQDLTLC